jgi:hypothetical protein
LDRPPRLNLHRSDAMFDGTIPTPIRLPVSMFVVEGYRHCHHPRELCSKCFLGRTTDRAHSRRGMVFPQARTEAGARQPSGPSSIPLSISSVNRWAVHGPSYLARCGRTSSCSTSLSSSLVVTCCRRILRRIIELCQRHGRRILLLPAYRLPNRLLDRYGLFVAQSVADACRICRPMLRGVARL